MCQSTTFCDRPHKHVLVWCSESFRPVGVDDERKKAEERAERRREALRTFVADRKLVVAEWARKAGLANGNQISNFLSGSSASLNVDTYEKLAKAEGVTVGILIGESYSPVAHAFRTVYIRGSVQAGAWKEATEWPRGEWIAVTLPLQGVADSITPYALRVVGPSMNLVFRDGDILICIPAYAFHRPLRSGDKVIVERRSREGLLEATCKEYREADGAIWLWPRSDDPEHQAPIQLPSGSSAVPSIDGDEWIRVTGVVIKSVREEAAP